MRFNLFNRAFQALFNLFYPHLCASCSGALGGDERVLCLHCIMSLPRTNFYRDPNNRAAQIFIGRIPIERAASFTYFTKLGIMQHLLHQLKYNGRSEIAFFLGQLFAEELRSVQWHQDIDLIVPVPLHRSRKYRRGYNQAEVFASAMADILDITLKPQLLSRQRSAASQTRMSRAERMISVEKAFKVQGDVRNMHILVVDDVLTTGATLESCARAFLDCGAARVSIATLAIALDA